MIRSPEPDIVLDVDLRNPGQFFACSSVSINPAFIDAMRPSNAACSSACSSLAAAAARPRAGREGLMQFPGRRAQARGVCLVGVTTSR